MPTGVLAALGATLLYNLGVIVQKTQAEQVGAGGVRILGSLARRPIWLLGIGVELSGFGLHYLALTRTPVTVVQPIIAAGIVFVVIFAALLLGERPGRRELAGMFMAVGGVTVLVAGLEGPSSMGEVSARTLGTGLATALAAVGVLLGLAASGWLGGAEARAVCLGSAAGIGHGMSDAMNRLMGAWLSPVAGWIPPARMGATALFCLVCFGFIGFVAAQNAYKSYRANTVVPCILTGQLLVPVVIAVSIYGQALPRGAADLATWAGALALTLAGVVTLATSPRVAQSYAAAA